MTRPIPPAALHRVDEDQPPAPRPAAGLAPSVATELGTLLARSGSVDALLARAAELLARSEAFRVVRIWVVEGDVLELRASAGPLEPAHEMARVRRGEGPVGRIAIERRALQIDEPHDASLPPLGDETARCFAGIPLESDDALVGVLAIRSRHPLPVETVASLEAIAILLALGIHRAQEQARLRVSELKHRLVAEASNEGIWFWDVRSNAVEWNDRLLEILGLDRASWGGDFMAWFERVHPDDQPAMQAALEAHLARKGPYWFERFRLRDASGEYRICRTRGQAEWDEEGRPLHMAGAVIDITKKVRAQEALAASELRYRQILDSVGDMVFSKTPDQTVAYANAATCRHYGLTREEIEGRVGSAEADGGDLLARHGDDHLVFESGTVVEDVEAQSAKHDGELRCFHVVKSPVLDRTGRVVELVGVARDITEHKRDADDQRFLGEASTLLASSIEYEQTLATLSRLAVPRFADWCAIDVLDDGGAIQRVAVAHVDPAKIELAHEVARRWPVDPSAATGVPAVIRSGRSEVHREIPDVLLDTIEDPELRAIIRELGLRSSMVVPLSVHGETLGAITLISAESGRVYDDRAVALAEELARRAAIAVENARLFRAAQRAVAARDEALEKVERFNVELERRVVLRTQELAEANRELESFTYTVSHDLRAPIRHISGFVDLLAAHAGDDLDDKGRRWLRTIGDASKQMGALIDALLAFSRMGRSEIARDVVDLGAIVEDVLRELEPDLAGRRIEWTIGALPVVRGDATMLRIVMTNLISNAVKYTRNRDEAHIAVGADLAGDGAGARDGELEVWVRDDGIGFDMEHAHKLFGVFQRLHASSDFEGTGIGLATVRRVVQRHGGRTWADGARDRGATFHFTLPREGARALPPQPPEATR